MTTIFLRVRPLLHGSFEAGISSSCSSYFITQSLVSSTHRPFPPFCFSVNPTKEKEAGKVRRDARAPPPPYTHTHTHAQNRVAASSLVSLSRALSLSPPC